MDKENSVPSLKTTPFERRSEEEKKKLKELGPDRPGYRGDRAVSGSESI